MEKIAGLNWAIATVIKEIREVKGLTQGQLAGFAGLSEVYLTKLERGLCGDSINALVQLATALGIQPSELMRRIETELANGPQKPEIVQGRPRQCGKQGK
jgi:transcriptional regulator with XRE-family HTH domain